MKVETTGLFLSYEQGHSGAVNDTLILQVPRTRNQADISNFKIEPRKVKVSGKIRIDLDAIKKFDMVKIERGSKFLPNNESLVVHADFEVNKAARFIAIPDETGGTTIKDLREFSNRRKRNGEPNPMPDRTTHRLGGGLKIRNGLDNATWQDMQYLGEAIFGGRK